MASAGRARAGKHVSKARASISAEPLAGSRARNPKASELSRKSLVALKNAALTSKGAEFKKTISELERRALKKTGAKAEAILQFLSENCKPAQKKIVREAIERIDLHHTQDTLELVQFIEAMPRLLDAAREHDRAGERPREQAAPQTLQPPARQPPAIAEPTRVDEAQKPTQPPRAVAELKPAVVEPARAEPPRVDVSTVSLEGLLAPRAVEPSPVPPRARRFSKTTIVLFSALALAAAALAYRAGVIPDFAPAKLERIEKQEPPLVLRVLEPYTPLPAKPATAEQPKPPAEIQPPALGVTSPSPALRPVQPEAGAAPPTPKDALSQAFDNAMRGVNLSDASLEDLRDAASAFAENAFKLKASFDEVKSKIEQLSSKFSDDYIFEMSSQADRIYVFYSLRAAAARLSKQHPKNAQLNDFLKSLDDVELSTLKASEVYDLATEFAAAARSAGLESSEVEKRVPPSVFILNLASYAVGEAQKLEAQAMEESKPEAGASAVAPESERSGKPSSESAALADKRELQNIYSYVLGAAQKIGGEKDFKPAPKFSEFHARLSALDPSTLSLQKVHGILVEYCLLMHAAGIDWNNMGGFMPQSDRFSMLNVQARGEAKKRVGEE